MYAKIVHDHLYEDEDSHRVQGWLIDETDRTGEIIFNGPPLGDILDVRLLDDDRIPYYTAQADDEALEHLFQWAMTDAGVTILQVKDKDGNWVDTIS